MIRIRNLTKRYNGTEAVRDVSLEVRPGDVFGFIGPNGAGKTTTLRILATLLDPTDGEVIIDGLDVVEEPEKVRRIIGFMPDYFGVYDGIHVWEYLDFFAGAYGIDRHRRRTVIRDVMDITDLGGLADRMVSELSKGMKQRLCLAKTLVHDPKVLLLDEPAAGLDPRARIELRALIRELRSMGKTIIISSHILTELADMCNAVGIIERGRLVAAGDVEGIARQLVAGYHLVLRFHDRTEEARALLASLPEVAQVEVRPRATAPDREPDLRIEYRGDSTSVHALVKALVDRGLPLIKLEEERQGLEDLFMKITRGDVQ